MGGGEFKREWFQTYTTQPETIAAGMNVYLLVDAANEKRKTSDYTAMWVIGLNADENVYVLDVVQDKLDLVERAREVMRLHRHWKPREVRYEKYGMMADIQYLREVQERENYRFPIVEVGGVTPKNDRIRRLIPYFESGRVYFPTQKHRTQYDGITRNLLEIFLEQEMLSFPVAKHDDMLDALARLVEPDLPLIWPKGASRARRENPRAMASWMAA